ncbi:MAG: ABC transporter ATP-binding protein [Coriobacteriales bacterium]|nr:ABC transporter ATP-binding protein [Coriobacteriales bacterium]
MAEESDTIERTDSWLPVIKIDEGMLDTNGVILLTVSLQGRIPEKVVYTYSWHSSNGIDKGESEPQRNPRFGFIPPYDGRFYLGVEALDSRGVRKTAGKWVNVGIFEETGFKRPPIPDDSVEKVISVDDVSMVFNIASEQFNSLKEYFIAMVHHELSFKPFRALDHVSFDVRRGEAVGLVGTNGSGKSTMLKIIAGVLEATEGSCDVKGSIAPLIELGAGFDMDLTARENIYLNGALLGYRKEFIDEHLDDIIDFAELHDFMDMPLKNYSSGMVARIAFAIATVTEPDILIVDETLSVGDFLFQRKCQNRIQELVGSGNVTVLLVSHSIQLVEEICDRVCWIEKGKLRMVGPTDDVCEAYRNMGN